MKPLRLVRISARGTPRWPALCVMFLAGLLTGTSVLAHHGWSDYDSSRTLTLKGVIKESSYSNPHGMIRLQVDGDKIVAWRDYFDPRPFIPEG